MAMEYSDKVMEHFATPHNVGVLEDANGVGEIGNAMRDPMTFAMNAFRDVPRELWNDPAKALQYIQQTRNISQADIQNMINSLPFPR